MTSIPNESELFAQYQENHSPLVREKLVTGYVSLVHYVLGRLGLSQDMGPDYEDLVNQGLIGLIEAVDRYNPAYGTQFSTYATVRIRGKVLDYLRSLDWLSRTARHRTRAVQTAMNELVTKLQRTPSNSEIAEHMGLEEPKVTQALADASHVIVSLDALTDIDQEGDGSLYEMLADDHQEDPSDVVAERDLKSQLMQAIEALPEREKLVLSLYYYDELTLKEIGQVLEISESRVCQLHARAILALKACMVHGDGIRLTGPESVVPDARILFARPVKAPQELDVGPPIGERMPRGRRMNSV